MAVLIVLHGKVPFVISLPHLIGAALLKPLYWRSCQAGFFGNHSITLENVVYCAGTGKLRVAFILQNPSNFDRTDCRMLLPVCQY